MNSAIRAVVRTGLFVNCRVFYVYDGFRGLVDNRVQEATWESATSLIQKGGSVLGVAPCDEFKTREGRLKGAKTLVLHGINNLIVIGGGGSMEALQTFKQEWRSLVQELVSKGLVPDNMGRPLQDLGVCGIPCAVTNDIWGTEMTLGADSALTRVIDSVDHVEASLNSSQRVFIVEVLGKHCGFLAMTAGLAVEADFVFVPEWPPVTEWREALTDKLQRMALTLEWGDVIGWVSEGGSALGTSRQLVSDPDRLAAHVLLHNIRGIAIIGGFEAFQSALMIRDWRDEYDSFRIPIVVVPATISIPSVAASRFGAKAFERMFSHSRRNTADIELLGVRFGDQAYADVGMLETLACFVHTNVRNPWWLTTHGLMRVLATQEKYMAEAIPPERSCNAKNYQTSAGQQPEFIGR
ncbi:unnamed protein product, partial [Mesorhabditis spiculigera]